MEISATKTKPILIKDLGYSAPLAKCKQKVKFGIYECPVCKKHFKARTANVVSNNTSKCRSCAASLSNITHGMSRHRIYTVWNDMMKRCFNNNCKEYVIYGGRGITVCERWKDVNNFIEDMHPSFQDGLELDRINNNGNYEPSNCRWTTRSVNVSNSRRKNNKHGYRGIYLRKIDSKFVARVTVNYKTIFIGSFLTSLEAAKAYDKYVIENNLQHIINGVL